jgi:hypothetical protein
VHQVAQDGDRLGLLERERDGVTHAKAHAQMFGPENSHNIFPVTLYRKVTDFNRLNLFKV